MTRHTRRPFLILIASVLALQAIIMAGGVAGILITDGARSYIGGEANYTKAQQRATAALRNFATDGDPSDFENFERYMRVPRQLGIARIILENPNLPNRKAHAPIVVGGFDPADTRIVIAMFPLMQKTQLFHPALEAWRKADGLVQRLMALGTEIETLRTARASISNAQERAWLTRIDRLDHALTVHQDAFTRIMEVNARRIRDYAIVAIAAGTLMLMAAGAALAWRTLKTIEDRQRALNRNKERFRDLADCAGDWFWETDADHRFTHLSQRLGGVLKTDVTRFIGQTRLEANGADPASPEWRDHLDTLDRHAPFRAFKYDCGMGASYRRLRISGKPVFDAKGRFTGYCGAGSDVTSEYLATRRAVAAKEEAEAANRAKSEFLANMSHELRTPLNAIIGFADIMTARLHGPDSPKYTDYAQDIANGGRHLLHLLNDILDLSKIEAEEMSLDRSLVQPGSLVEETIRMMRPNAEAAGIRLQTDVPDDLPDIDADAQRLRQILLNLVGNAIKFSHAGGTVTVSARADARTCALDVVDQGIGIPKDQINNVIQPFRQVDASMTRRHEGTGLGLALVARFAELHGGWVRITSEPGQGTRVRVEIPRGTTAHSIAA